MDYTEAVERLKRSQGAGLPVPTKPTKPLFDGFVGTPSSAPTEFHGLEQVAPEDLIPPLSRASEARRQKVLAMLARDGGQYAVHVEDPNTDPVVMALATPGGTCDVLIPRDRYDPFAVLEMVKSWERVVLPERTS